MGNVVAFEEEGEDTASAEGVWLEGHEEQNGWGKWVVGSEEVEVKVGDQASWEVHDYERASSPTI